MAVVQLADIIEPSLFTQYVVQKTTELSAFFQSGVVQQTDLMNQLTAAASNTFTVPFWNALASTEPNVSSDNNASAAVPMNINASSQVGIKQRRNQAWSAMDIVAGVAGSDPMQQIVNGVAGYWSRVLNQNIIAICNGIKAANVAQDSGDMVNDISDDAVGAPGAATLVTGPAVIDTWATLGDHSGDIVAIAMHSVVYHNLQAQDLITFVPTSRQELGIPTYLGKAVIVDDSLPAAAQTNQIWYTTVLFGRGALAYGEGSPRVPTEIERSALSGDGAGQETLVSRKDFCVHPGGFAWLSASMAGTTPTNAELATAANYDRRFARKNIPIAFLQSNG